MKETMNFPLLLALRFLQGSSHEKTLSTMIRICFFSIMLGTGSLTLIAAIMQGFETATYKKLQGVNSDLVISTDDGAIDYSKLNKFLTNKYSHAIKATSPSSLHHVMLQIQTTPKDNESPLIQTIVCLLRSIDPQGEPMVSNLSDMLVESTGKAWNNLTSDTIFMGKTLASRLKLQVGSKFSLLYQPEEETMTTTLKNKEVTLAGLYATGIHDYDDQIIMCSHELANQLFPERITHVALSVHNNVNTDELKKELSQQLELTVNSWKDLYPSLVSALALEKYAMWIILMLVTLVASLTIVSLLYMYATHKQTDIALLKAMGMEDYQLRHLLIGIASLITLSATTCGIILASCATWILNTYPFLHLPDVYFVSTLPANLTGAIILSVYMIALLISLCAGLFPNSALKTMRLASTLKGIGL